VITAAYGTNMSLARMPDHSHSHTSFIPILSCFISYLVSLSIILCIYILQLDILLANYHFFEGKRVKAKYSRNTPKLRQRIEKRPPLVIFIFKFK
jgi:hypothetical protein